MYYLYYSEWQDSNLRPPVPKTDALPTALHSAYTTSRSLIMVLCIAKCNIKLAFRLFYLSFLYEVFLDKGVSHSWFLL